MHINKKIQLIVHIFLFAIVSCTESNYHDQTFLCCLLDIIVIYFLLCSSSPDKMSECDDDHHPYSRNCKLVCVWGTTSHHLSKGEGAFHSSLSRILEIFLSASSNNILSKEEIWISKIQFTYWFNNSNPNPCMYFAQ